VRPPTEEPTTWPRPEPEPERDEEGSRWPFGG
jgi:hypothetical protein